MLIMRTSPRILKATEKYVASIGRKREELTEEQWNLLVKHVEARRVANPFLLLAGLFCISMTYLFWHQAHKYVTNIVPNHTITVSFNNQNEPIILTPEEIREYLKYITDGYMLAGMQSMLAFQLLGFAVLSMALTKRTNRKAHRILLSRPTETVV